MFVVIFLEQWLKEEHHITPHDWYCSVSNMSNHFWLKFLYDTYDGSYRYHANVIEKKHRIVGGAEMIILQQIITIALCIFGTMLTRFCRLSFLV